MPRGLQIQVYRHSSRNSVDKASRAPCDRHGLEAAMLRWMLVVHEMRAGWLRQQLAAGWERRREARLLRGEREKAQRELAGVTIRLVQSSAWGWRVGKRYVAKVRAVTRFTRWCYGQEWWRWRWW